jgi:putative ABC transport system ATP-binding protein
MIEIRDLEFHYPESDFALRVPALGVGTSERVAVIGPSGSGKTTLLNLLAGIVTADAGEIRVDGVDLVGLDDAHRRDFRISRIGFVFQNFELLDYLSVLDNILHPYRITRALTLDRAVRERACALAEDLGIGNKLARFPANLSQGERQRAAICRALLPGPRLVLADEATGNLDPANKTRILDLLFRSAKAHGATVLAVTHDHGLLERFDRVVDFRDFVPEGA